MAEIPTQSTPTVKPREIGTPYSDVNAPASAFGVGLGEAGMQAGESLSRYSDILAAHREQADQTRVNYELANFDTARTAALGEALQTEGQNSIGASDRVAAALTKQAQDTSKALASDKQRDLFTPHAIRMIADTKLSVLRHEAQQTKQMSVESATARISSAYDTASKTWNQPEMMAGALSDVASGVEAQAQAKGWSDEVKAKALFDANSGLYATILRAQDTQGAHAAFLQTFPLVEKYLNAQDAATFAPAFKARDQQVRSYDLADQIFKANTAFDARGRLVTMNENAINAAANSVDPIYRKEVVQEVQNRVSTTLHADDEIRRNTVQSAWAAFENAGGHVSGIPAALLADVMKYDGTAMESFRRAEAERAKPETASKWTPEGLAAYGNYERMLPADHLKPGNDAISMLMGRGVPMETVKEALHNEGVTNAESHGVDVHGQMISHRGPNFPIGLISSLVTTQAQINGIGQNRTPQGDAEFGSFKKGVEDNVQAWMEGNPDKKPDKKVVDQAILDYLGQNATEETHPVRDFFRSLVVKKPVNYETNPVVTIPHADRVSISASIAANGGLVTEDLIRKVYDRLHPKVAAQ